MPVPRTEFDTKRVCTSLLKKYTKQINTGSFELKNLLPMEALLLPGLSRPEKGTASIGGMWSQIKKKIRLIKKHVMFQVSANNCPGSAFEQEVCDGECGGSILTDLFG